MLGIDKKEKVLVGVSGGPDSMFLLTKLVQEGYEKIVVCHVNYHARPTATRDEKIVENYCLTHHLKYYCKNVDQELQAKKPGNFEEVARLLRYDFFSQVGKIEQTNYLFIAHNLNDHIETYLLQSQRNNLVDHYGLKPISNYEQLLVLRPLLGMKKSEILGFVQEEKIPFGIDETNFDLKYARNQLRTQLVENDFTNYLTVINTANRVNDQDKQLANEYLVKNLVGSKLSLVPDFYSLKTEQVMFVLINYLAVLKLEMVFLKRKNKTLKELAQELLTSQKPMFRIKVQNYFCIKDFDWFYMVEENSLKIEHYEIKDQDELAVVLLHQENDSLKKVISTDGFQFPYLVTNDFENYKTKTFCGNKKANRFFINHKISYEQRFKEPAIIRMKNKQIINYQNFLRK